MVADVAWSAISRGRVRLRVPSPSTAAMDRPWARIGRAGQCRLKHLTWPARTSLRAAASGSDDPEIGLGQVEAWLQLGKLLRGAGAVAVGVVEQGATLGVVDDAIAGIMGSRPDIEGVR